MRKMKLALWIAVGVGLSAPGAMAAVNNTHHDLVYWGSQSKEVCFWCHGALDKSTVTGYEKIGALCVTRCHGGTTVGANYANSAQPIPNIAATVSDAGAAVAMTANLSALSGGHKFGKNNLYDPRAGTVVSIAAAGLPYTSGAASVPIECTSCHNVHDSTNTPFLQRDLFTGGTNKSFCEICHTERGTNWFTAEVAPSGEHPVNVTLALGTVSSRTLGGRISRYIQLDRPAAVQLFDTATTNGSALNAPSAHYTVGGKVSSWGLAVAGNRFGCYTCHVAHQPNTSQLVARNTIDSDDATIEWNPLCVSCHGSAVEAGNKNEWNPGTTQFGHPVGPTSNAGTLVSGSLYTYTATTGRITYRVNVGAVVNYTAVSGNGKGGVQMGAGSRLLCTSCHDVHGGATGTMAIADLDGTNNGAMTGAVCYRCHLGSDLPDVTDNNVALTAAEPANSHHRTSIKNWTTAGTQDADNDVLNMGNPSWAAAAAPTGDTFGDLTDGLQCPDCHMGRNPAGTALNGTAHNW